MHTATAEVTATTLAIARLQAADAPVVPIRDHGMPIQPYKRPPTEEDFRRQKERRKRSPEHDDSSSPGQPAGEGHIDDFA